MAKNSTQQPHPRINPRACNHKPGRSFQRKHRDGLRNSQRRWIRAEPSQTFPRDPLTTRSQRNGGQEDTHGPSPAMKGDKPRRNPSFWGMEMGDTLSNVLWAVTQGNSSLGQSWWTPGGWHRGQGCGCQIRVPPSARGEIAPQQHQPIRYQSPCPVRENGCGKGVGVGTQGRAWQGHPDPGIPKPPGDTEAAKRDHRDQGGLDQGWDAKGRKAGIQRG